MAGLCVWYLLRRQVRLLVGIPPQPTQGGIAKLVDTHYAAFSTLIRGSPDRLERTLLTVFDMLPQDERIGPGDAIVWGTAALGVMSSDPKSDLATARPQLSAWCIEHSDDLHDLGLR